MKAMKGKDHKIWTSPSPKSINKMIKLLPEMMFQNIFLCMVKYIPWTQGMCNEIVHIKQSSLAFVPDNFKTQEMYSKVVENEPYTLKFVPVHLKTAGMCKRAIEKYLHPMRDVPDHLKTHDICNKAVEENPWLPGDFPYHLKTQGCLKKQFRIPIHAKICS